MKDNFATCLTFTLQQEGGKYATGTYGSAVSATGAVTRHVLCTNTAAPTTYAQAFHDRGGASSRQS